MQMHRLAFVFEEDGIHFVSLSFVRTEAFFTLRAVSPALLLGTDALSGTLPVAGVKERKEV